MSLLITSDNEVFFTGYYRKCDFLFILILEGLSFYNTIRFNVAMFTELVCLSCVIPRSCYLDSYMGQFMRLWYLLYTKNDVDEGSGQTMRLFYLSHM